MFISFDETTGYANIGDRISSVVTLVGATYGVDQTAKQGKSVIRAASVPGLLKVLMPKPNSGKNAFRLDSIRTETVNETGIVLSQRFGPCLFKTRSHRAIGVARDRFSAD